MAFKLRKRVVITALLTLVILATTNNLWLIRKPIRTELDILGAKDAKVEVQLNRKDNNDFVKINYASVNVSSDKEHLIIKNRTSKPAKRFRLEISNLEKGKILEIKNVQLHFNKCKLNELDKFVIKGADFEIKDNALLITPNKQTITVLYNKPIKEKAPKKFEVEIFVIILILSSLLGYKLVDYAADFSSIGHKSRVDIIFLSIFFMMLFIPMSHINQNNKSVTENRMLAKWKPLVNKDGSINYEFGKDYENWFNDRFNMRENLIATNWIIPKRIQNRIINGKSGWLFLNLSDDRTLKNYLNINQYSDSELKKIVSYLTFINDYCKKNHKQFYLLICPDKHKIYGEYFPNIAIKRIPDTESPTAQVINHLKINTDVKVIYPLEELTKTKNKNYTYWKTDSHWTDYGAYISYKKLMDEIMITSPEIKPLIDFSPKKQIRLYGDLANMVPQIIRKADYNEYITYHFNRAIEYRQELKSNPIKPDVFTKDNFAPNNTKVIFYRDSFSNNLIPFVSRTFKEVSYLRKHHIKISELKDFDIVVLEIVERNVPNLINFKKEF